MTGKITIMSILWIKVWHELWAHKGRTAQAVLSIAAGVFALGAMFGLADQLLTAMDEAHLRARPSHANLILAGALDEAQLEDLRALPGVAGVDPASQLTARYRSSTDADWAQATFVNRPDYGQQTYDTLTLVSGRWPTAADELAVERLTAQRWGLREGQSLEVALDGEARAFTLVGLVRHPFVQPPDFGGQAFFFTDTAGMAEFGIPEGRYNQVLVQVRDYTPDHARTVVDDLRRWLGDNRVGVAATIFQDPERHWGRRFVEGVTLVLQVMAVATLAMSVVLVLNTTSALITQQLDQIGVLKAIGARTWSVAWPYGVQVLAYGVLALTLALPLGALTAFGATQWFLNLFNIDYPTLRWSPWAIGWQVAAALIAPVLAAAWPIARGAAISVREAIATYGLSGDFGGTRFDRAVDRLAERFLPATYAAAVSNTFRRKQRLAFTVAVLVFGGVMFMVVMSLITSVNATIAADIERRRYDSRLGLQSVARISEIESALAGAPDVQIYELWLGRGALVAHSGREVRDSAGLGAALVGVPVEGRLYRPNVIAGRWFTADDAGQNVVVLDAETAADNGLALGDTIDVDLGAPPAQAWRIIGLYRVVTGANFTTEEVYAPFPAVARAAAVPAGANIVLVRTGATALDQARAASDRIETRLTDAGLPLEAFTTSIKLEERDFANNQFAPTVGMFLGLASLVATVGGIGLMSALVLGVLERRREIGVLRAIGARTPTLTALFVLEGVIIGLLSWMIAVPLSIVLAPALAEQLGLTMLELRLDYVFDWSAIWIWLVVVIVTGLVYSIGPALSAARVSVREALAYS